jgi:hypothetical protein
MQEKNNKMIKLLNIVYYKYVIDQCRKTGYGLRRIGKRGFGQMTLSKIFTIFFTKPIKQFFHLQRQFIQIKSLLVYLVFSIYVFISYFICFLFKIEKGKMLKCSSSLFKSYFDFKIAFSVTPYIVF